MNFIEEIEQYEPVNEQEATDKGIMLEYIRQHEGTVLTRDNQIAHMTASAIVLNADRDKILMIHHNIYNTWTWVGGHADGESDMLKLALKEAREETGIQEFIALEGIRSLDIIWVGKHMKQGRYVPPHLHMNVSYVFIADDNDRLILNEQETSDIRWIPVEEMPLYSKEEDIIYIYHKLINH